MKKIISIAILFVMVALLATTVVNAATSSTLADQLYAIGQKYGMKASEKVKMERYLADNKLSDAKCDEILALAQEADQIMKENGETDYTKLPADIKAQLKSLANQAASVAGVTLTFSADGIHVYKDGKLIENLTESSTLPYTGNNVNSILVVSSVAVVALATIFVARKKFANA